MAKESGELVKELMGKLEHIRNIGIVAHIDHGKTTLSDNLLAGAGMISEELAGKQLAMDFDAQEQERGITIFAANASMIHTVENQDYLVNLIDTPGHVDFGGDVTRAMRAVDGVIVVCDAVEGVMPQTETVIRQALRERVRPILYINKADRLIKELKLTPEEMQEKFKKIITEVNMLIQKYAETEYKDKWAVSVEDGKVAFGSAKNNWALSVPYMRKSGITFKEVIELTEKGKEKEELSKKAACHRVLLDMVVKHLPSPKEAQKYRIPKIWPGDPDSQEGKDMMACSKDGSLAGIVTKIYTDPHAGFVATVRIYSGKLTKGQDVYLVAKQKVEKIQQVSIWRGPHRLSMDEVYAGNIVGIVGLRDAFSGETISAIEKPIVGFEGISHIFEPVVTKSIEPKHPKDLGRLIEFLKKIGREDPTLQVKINEDTGEYLISGLGELHLDAKVERPLKDAGIDVAVSPPIVIFNESVKGSSEAVEGKSPNKHNRFYITATPLEKEVYDAMVNGEIQDQEIKKKNLDLQTKLIDLGFDKEESKKIKLIHNKNMLLDMTHGVHAILEVMEMVKEAFTEAMNEGPQAREPCGGVKISIVDAKLHEDAIHRGPAQVIPAVRRAIRDAMINAKAFLLEPKQVIRIDVPIEQVGGATKEISNRRGQILEMTEERGLTMIKAKLPVNDMFGFNSSLKSATGGLGFYSLIDVLYEPMPKELEPKVIQQIRERKGITSMEEEKEEE